jgi:hypothetical protein
MQRNNGIIYWMVPRLPQNKFDPKKTMDRLPLHWEVCTDLIELARNIKTMRPLHTAHLYCIKFQGTDSLYCQLKIFIMFQDFNCLPQNSFQFARLGKTRCMYKYHIPFFRWNIKLVGIWCILPSLNRCHLWLDINVVSYMYSWRLTFLDMSSGEKIQSIVKKNMYRDIMQFLNCINKRLKRSGKSDQW